MAEYFLYRTQEPSPPEGYAMEKVALPDAEGKPFPGLRFTRLRKGDHFNIDAYIANIPHILEAEFKAFEAEKA